MLRSISKDDLRFVLHKADVTARSVRLRLRLSRGDLEDTRQDLLVDFLARLPAFDSTRGSIGAFASLVMANRATRIARMVRHHLRLYGVVPISLDDLLPDGDGTTVGETIAESSGYLAMMGQPTDRFANVDRRLDLDRALRTLRRSERKLCGRLVGSTPNELSHGGHGSRASIYRQLREIRLQLMISGLSAAA